MDRYMFKFRCRHGTHTHTHTDTHTHTHFGTPRREKHEMRWDEKSCDMTMSSLSKFINVAYARQGGSRLGRLPFSKWNGNEVAGTHGWSIRASWDACKELRWAELCKSPLPPCSLNPYHLLVNYYPLFQGFPHTHTLDKNWSIIGSVGNWIPCMQNQTSPRY